MTTVFKYLRVKEWTVLASISFFAFCASQRGFSASGTISSITPGKDGYMAELITKDGTNYNTTISRIRLQQQYQQLAVGDQVKISGDTIHTEQGVTILAKGISKQ
ncbi:hypothetical protein [Sediminibacterium ginsengisoli]|uniref:DUF5666 domain-containing protein n=1 Tax=Sediminibacterium ginsengisoli TaxID=413434 RepID=A0A1T4MDR4_9BACT|nr:hypothetical protein [Sediminibacterium ginsengisoli]SJZ65073.1 hypothetical protein SAMN04488132_103331 [Sediminibacterium ginsengisoli]